MFSGVESLGNRLGELSEVVQVAAAELIDDVPINGLITMDGNVSESDCFCHTLAECGTDELKALEDLEILYHRGGRTSSFGNEMGCHINGKLHGTSFRSEFCAS
ncbi:MAG TPA: hypothetical protein VK901_19585 [Nitrospiraceae bacterium]|nr:hypothetical protein [Nitrospiraceae bacterium]